MRFSSCYTFVNSINIRIVQFQLYGGFPGGTEVKNLSAMQKTLETRIQSLGQEDPLEEEMATHSSIFAWGSPWTKGPGGLQSTGSQRVGHD